MAVRKRPRSGGTAGRRSTRKRTSDLAMRQFSAIVGCALVGVAVLCFVWLLVRQMNPGVPSLTLPFSGVLPQNPTSTPVNPLVAAGITLAVPGRSQEPLLTQQQAILLADQMQSEIATHAGKVDAQYTLFSYKGNNSGVASFRAVPVWLVHYADVSEPPAATASDPRTSGAYHDFYIFLDANSGRELLAIWL